MSRHGTVRDAWLPEGLSKRKLQHHKRDVYHLLLDVVIVLSLIALAPEVYTSGSALLGGAFAVTIVYISYYIAKYLRRIYNPTLHLRVSTLPTLRSARVEHIAADMAVGTAEHMAVTAGEQPGEATISKVWVVMVELEPEREDGWYREGYVVEAETMAEVFETLAVELGDDFEKHQVVHMREAKPIETPLTENITVTNAVPWIDARDDPMKVYTTMQLTNGLSFFTNAEHTGGPHLIGHSVAGAWRATEHLHGTRTFTEVVAHHEIHELVHWACDHKGDVQLDESAWDGVLYDVLDYVQEDEHPDGPWAFEERKNHIRLTRPSDTEAD